MQTSAPISLVPTPDATEHRMAAHIREAAEATGVPFDFLLAQASQESRLDPNARSRRSSAMGLFQFTAGTWLDMVRKHGADHGLGQYADAIEAGAGGRLTVKDKALKKEILDLRRDPRLSALMAAEYAKDNEKVMEARLGRQVSSHDLYLAHFLGAGGALKVLSSRGQEADAETPAVDLSGAAKANPEVFTDPQSGEERSLASIYTVVERRFRQAMGEAARLADEMRPRVDLAALRPEGRPDEPVPQPEPQAAATPVEPPAAARLDLAALRPEARPARDGEVPAVSLAALRPEARPEQEGSADAAAAAGSDAPVAVAALAMTMADIPADTSPFPARLPLRPAADLGAYGSFPAEIQGQGLGRSSYPVTLPPPLSGAHADAGTLRSLMTLTEEKG